LHPLILYNANDADEKRRAELSGEEVLKLCVELGGCLTGEHGVGIEKRELMAVQFNEVDLAQQMRIKSVFDPDWLLNPGKVFPLKAQEAYLARAKS
jgi:glycolate oxidase